jgi:hypothetical protein
VGDFMIGEVDGFGLAPGAGATFGGGNGEGDCRIPFCSIVLKRVINPIAPFRISSGINSLSGVSLNSVWMEYFTPLGI